MPKCINKCFKVLQKIIHRQILKPMHFDRVKYCFGISFIVSFKPLQPMLKVLSDVWTLKKPMMTNIQKEPRTSLPDIITTTGLNKTHQLYFQWSN